MKKAISVIFTAMLFFSLAGIAGATEKDGVEVSFYRDATEYTLGQNVIMNVENKRDEAISGRIYPELYSPDSGTWSDFDWKTYPIYLEPGWIEEPVYFTGAGGDLTQAGKWRFRIEIEGEDPFYSEEITLKAREY